MRVTVAQRVEIRAVAWDDPEAVALRDAMTAEVAPRYADRAGRMPMPPGMAVQPSELIYAAVAFQGERGVGHIALRRLPDTPAGPEPDELEIKRMFVAASVRGQGVGRLLLAAAEQAAAAAGARRVVLQTGDRQPEAATLYESVGYTRIPIFAPYLALPYSLCFEKVLSGQSLS
jgi:GNAT superfamily N-acetyltransferase